MMATRIMIMKNDEDDGDIFLRLLSVLTPVPLPQL